MDTSENTRYIILLVLFVLGCVVALQNLRLLAALITRRRVPRWRMILWPVLLALGVLSVVDTFCWEANWVQVTRHTTETPKLAKNATVRIVQLSDFHIRGRLAGRYVRTAEIVRSLKPDVIVLTGDYTNDKDPVTISSLTRFARMLAEVAPTYAVEGNWDAGQDMGALKKAGVVSLDTWDRVRCRGSAVALGHAEWYRGVTQPVPPTYGGLYTIVLCHMPGHFDRLRRLGVDLVLAGHTHGGQVRLPVFGALLPERRLVGKYQMGFYKVGGALMYVNRGLGCEGTFPEVRFCCRPEIAVFDLVGISNQ